MTDDRRTSGIVDPASYATVAWEGDARSGRVVLIDQTKLPGEFVTIACGDVETVWEAIRALRVRGAPAIGVAAAYGALLGAREGLIQGDLAAARTGVLKASARLRTSRPTAVNLFWALDRIDRIAQSIPDNVSVQAFFHTLLDEARSIEAEDRAMCRAIGRHGAALVSQGQGILTHCNAGGLATADYGTALAVLFTAHEQGKDIHVYADETRPLLQGARLTAWELRNRGVPVTLICDSMAAVVMKEHKINLVIVGADRIASNGDTANKIGTYGVAVLAHAHGIPFYVAAPSSTFDLSIPDGGAIPIEERDPKEITEGFGKKTAPEGVHAYNPAFDVTPARLIAAIVTERGIVQPVNEQNIRSMLKST